MSPLEVLWFFLVFVLIGGYFVLDGFDLGIGVLFPFIAKSEEDQAVLRRAIGPIWDGNEVWLITAGGALFAAFPDAYATTFSGYYLPIMLVLFGLIVRAVSFEFHAGDPAWRKVWDVCFFVGSLLPALLLGVAAGITFEGIPMDAHGNYIGVPLFGLITPFSLLCGLTGLSMMMAAGANWIALKAPKPSALQARCAKLGMPLQIVALVLFVAATACVFLYIHPTMDPALNALRWIFAALVVGGLVVSMFFSKVNDNDLFAFVSHSVASFSMVALGACSMFPNLVVASSDSVGPNITLMSAGASDLTLFCMTVILCIGLPLVLVYHVIIYRTFRGRLTQEDLTEGAY